MRPQTLLILTAVMLEAKAIARAMEMPSPAPQKPSKADRNGFSITLAVIGVCAPYLPDGAADLVLMAGLAGALDPSLSVGDLVVDDWPASLPLPPGVRRGTIHTCPQIAATATQKADLFTQTQAVAVDMENTAVREWARRRGAEFAAVRAISDRADQPLDPKVLRLVDAWGRPRPLAIGLTLIRHPRLIAHLMGLGADSKAAARQLGAWVRERTDEFIRFRPAPAPPGNEPPPSGGARPKA